MSDKDKDLELATMEALRGAGDVRKRILLELSTGVPSIFDLAYAIKIRIKDDFRISEKVIDKRKKKPEYQVNHIRDVVGLRIVTLYRLDALKILPILLERIKSNQGDLDDNLFMSNSVEEIIIYSTNPQGDAQNFPGRIKAIFDSQGFKEKISINQTPQNYTSVHIVVWCRGKYRDIYRPIPVEIQIRTALEDVWGEIDHSLKYKRKEADEKGSYETETRLATSLSHLNVMKTLIDGLAQYADQIKIQLDEIDEHQFRAHCIRLAEPPMQRIDRTSITPDLYDQIEQAIGIGKASLQDDPRSQKSRTERLQTRARAKSEIMQALKASKSSSSIDEIVRNEIDYVIRMELALLAVQSGAELGISAGNDELVEADKIYEEFEQLFPDRSIIKYRRARVLDLLGDTQSAIGKLEGLIRNEDSIDLPEGHWVRSSMRRQLGTFYWKESESVKGEDSGQNSSRVLMLRKAIDVTRPALTLETGPVPDLGNDPRVPSAYRTLNNYVYFVVCYLEQLGNTDSIADLDMTLDEFASLVEELAEGPSEGDADYRHLDTCRKAFQFLGREAEARASALRVVELLHELGHHDRGGDSREESVLRAAESTLSK